MVHPGHCPPDPLPGCTRDFVRQAGLFRLFGDGTHARHGINGISEVSMGYIGIIYIYIYRYVYIYIYIYCMAYIEFGILFGN